MRVLLTGASGLIGSALMPELMTHGHTVVGLARSNRAAEVIQGAGAEVLRADLDDVDQLRQAAAGVDGVVHLAFKHEQQRAGDLAAAVQADVRAIAALSEGLTGTGRPFVGTSATGALALAGFSGLLEEDDAMTNGPRIDAENTVIALAKHGVRSSVVRLPPTVHGAGRFGFVSGLMAAAREAGASGYLGDGSNRWPSVATADAARVFRLALESAPAGTRLHAVAEEGVPLRDIAAAIGQRLDLPVEPVDAQDANHRFGYLAAFVGLDNPAASSRTRHTLEWTPTRPGLLTALLERHPD